MWLAVSNLATVSVLSDYQSPWTRDWQTNFSSINIFSLWHLFCHLRFTFFVLFLIRRQLLLVIAMFLLHFFCLLLVAVLHISVLIDKLNNGSVTCMTCRTVPLLHVTWLTWDLWLNTLPWPKAWRSGVIPHTVRWISVRFTCAFILYQITWAYKVWSLFLINFPVEPSVSGHPCLGQDKVSANKRDVLLWEATKK